MHGLTVMSFFGANCMRAKYEEIPKHNFAIGSILPSTCTLYPVDKED